MRVVVLMAYRGDGEGYGGSGWRDRAYTLVHDHLDGVWPMYVHDSGDQPFNISKSYNQAAEAAGDWDVAVIHPPDVWTPLIQLQDAVCEATDRIVQPNDRIRKMDEKDTATFLAGERDFKTVGYTGAYPPLIIPRWLWDEIGGFDETLIGHGHEDYILIHCADVLGRRRRYRHPGFLYVLWHPKDPPAFYTHVDANARAYEAYEAITDPDALRNHIASRTS